MVLNVGWGWRGLGRRRPAPQLLNQAVEDQLGDLLICLGQEEQKVHVLTETVAAFGMDVQKLLAMHGLDDVSLGYAGAYARAPA